MSNLIVTVIAIALVAVASLMGAYYGGSAFLEGSAKANASTLVNQGQQITGAWALKHNDTANPTISSNLSELTSGNYLSAIPTAPSGAGPVNAYIGDINGAIIYQELASTATEVCQFIQEAATGSTTVADIALATVSDFPSQRFGCVQNNAGALIADNDYAFFFRK